MICESSGLQLTESHLQDEQSMKDESSEEVNHLIVFLMPLNAAFFCIVFF